MNALTPTAQAVLDALHDTPATAPELRERLTRGRSTIDKALAELARTGLATKTDDDHWTPTDPAPQNPTPDTDPTITTDADESAVAEKAAVAVEGADDGQAVTDPVPEVKVCRGCQTQMPLTCPTCHTRTGAYCAECRRQRPARRTGTGPDILSTGLPKLARGELARLVEDVMRTQPLPDHLGITGWTSGRIAIFLPGRSTGAIANALDRLTATGTTQLLADNPRRYRLTPTDNDTTDDDTTTDDDSATTNDTTTDDTES